MGMGRSAQASGSKSIYVKVSYVDFCGKDQAESRLGAWI